MYEELFDKLDEMDATVDDTLDRLMGDEEMYVKFLSKFPQDKNIHALRAAVEAKDAKAAEAAVHTLKGVALNLGLLPLVDVCMDMLLDLRAGEVEQAFDQMDTVEDAFNEWSGVIKGYLPEEL